MRLLAFALAFALLGAGISFAEEGQETGVPFQADLVFEKAEVVLKSTATGEIVVNARVKNQGQKETGPFFVYLYSIPKFMHTPQASAIDWSADCKLVSRENSFVENLMPASGVDVKFTVTCKKQGKKIFLIKADFFNKVRESDESKNIAKVSTDFQPRVAVEGCVDSDEGIEPSTRGFVKQGYKTAYDTCVGTFLREYYCDASGALAYQLVTCEKGCAGGACRR